MNKHGRDARVTNSPLLNLCSSAFICGSTVLKYPGWGRLSQAAGKSGIYVPAGAPGGYFYVLMKDAGDWKLLHEYAAERSQETSASDDPIGEAGWRASLARAYAHTGRVEEAEVLVAEAVEIVSSTEHLLEQADALKAQAEVLELAGKPDGAVEAARRSLERYREKGVIDSAHPIGRLEALIRRNGAAPAAGN